MTARSRTILEGFFNTGDKPTETEFAELIESFYHRDDFGWGEYEDSQYTTGSPLSLLAATDTLLNNDGVNGNQTQEPSGVELYDAANKKIAGKENEARVITISFKLRPTHGSTVYGEVWFNVGGASPERFRQLFSIPKGSGVEHSFVITVATHADATWEANGADVYIRTNNTAEVYDIQYDVVRAHKVF